MLWAVSFHPLDKSYGDARTCVLRLAKHGAYQRLLAYKLGMGLMYYFANKKIRSQAIRAVMLDSFLDLGITATSVVAFAVTTRVDYAVDAIVGIVMSIVIIAIGIKMVVENVRAIVVGDGAKEEKKVVEQVCQDNGVTLEKTDIHDYGYGAKVGNAYISANEGIDTQKLHDDVLAASNADITFVLSSKSNAEDENDENNRDKNKERFSSLENTEK